MIDIVDQATRSRMMSGIRGKNTSPERLIRSELHRRGFRFRLHYKGLPGKPDIVLPKYRAVILVNGCFWHGHKCHLFKWPATNEEKWRRKIEGNVIRDQDNIAAVRGAGWRTLVVWECALRGPRRMTINSVGGAIEAWLRNGAALCEISGDTACRVRATIDD